MGGIIRYGRSIDDQESRSTETTRGSRSGQEKFVYRPGPVELYASSLESLKPNQYLNDEIIQFYNAYLIKDQANNHIRDKFHVFDSYFHEQLTDLFPDDPKKPFDPEKWWKLRSWLGGVDIFEKDFLIFPICRENHWNAVIVCYPKEVRECDAKLMSPDSNTGSRSKPIAGIIFLDSLGCEKRILTSPIRYFLDLEWRTRSTVIKNFSYHNLEQYHPRLPKQTNSHDCGIFMLAYLRAFIGQPDRFYRLVRQGRDKEAETNLEQLVNNSLVNCGRAVIENLINQLCDRQGRSDSPMVI